MPAHPHPAAMTADQFRAILEAAGLNQSDAAKRLGVSPATVFRWANAQVSISAEKAALIRERIAPHAD